MPTPTPMELALQVKERIETEMLGHSFVSGIDVGPPPDRSGTSNDVVIRIYVTDTDRAATLPKEVDGVPICVIARRFELH